MSSDVPAATSGPALLKGIEAATGELLRPLGFRKRVAGIFTTELAPGVLGWIGLNHAAHRNWGYDINPVVGVRHQELERIRAELLGRKPHSYEGPTLATTLNSLIGLGHPNWSFPGGLPVGPMAERMVAAIRDFGLPYLRAHDSLEKMMPEIPKGVDLSSVAERQAIANLLLGRYEDAERIIATKLEKVASDNAAYAIAFRAFADRFRRHAAQRRAATTASPPR